MRRTVAEAMVAALADAGVGTVFGIPRRSRAGCSTSTRPSRRCSRRWPSTRAAHVTGRLGPPRVTSARWPLAGAHPAPGISC